MDDGRSAPSRLTHLQRLEAESIHIMREVVAQAERPVMLYSIGKLPDAAAEQIVDELARRGRLELDS